MGLLPGYRPLPRVPRAEPDGAGVPQHRHLRALQLRQQPRLLPRGHQHLQLPAVEPARRVPGGHGPGLHRCISRVMIMMMMMMMTDLPQP